MHARQASSHMVLDLTGDADTINLEDLNGEKALQAALAASLLDMKAATGAAETAQVRGASPAQRLFRSLAGHVGGGWLTWALPLRQFLCLLHPHWNISCLRSPKAELGTGYRTTGASRTIHTAPCCCS